MSTASLKVRSFASKAGLAIVTFIAGLSATAFLYSERVQQQRQQHARELTETARQYAFLLQRRLDLYATGSDNLDAFFTASSFVTREEFDNFVDATRMFGKLDAISSFGYLPRVPAAQVPAFEREAAAMFPGYRVRHVGQSDAYFPLLYLKLKKDPDVVEIVRGLDYASMQERKEAMQQALERDEPAATRVHIAASASVPVVVIFSPIHQPGRKATLAERRAQLKGYVFSVLIVDELFERFDNGRLASQFDLEVYDGQEGARSIVYDADGARHGLSAAPELPLAHRTSVQFADRSWIVHFYAKPQAFEGAIHSNWMALAIGFMLSMIAAYATWLANQALARRRASNELATRFDAFFEHHPFAVYSLDPQRRFVRANRKLAEELGVSQQELVGAPADKFVTPETKVEASMAFKRVLAGETVAYNNVIIGAQGRRLDVSIILIPIGTGGKVTNILGFAENITERRKLEQELFHRANYDSLTGLPNRAFFFSHLEQAVRRAHRSRGELALMYFDIDRFKHINDTHGHAVGDEVIRIFASRVRSALREVDLLARLGGDEFVLVLEGLADRAAAAAVADKIVDAVRPVFETAGQRIQVSSSIGIAFLEDGMFADLLLTEADHAMYAAKQAGRNCYRQSAGRDAGVRPTPE